MGKRPKGKALRVVLIGLFILALLVTALQPALADATVGETVVTLGKDLTPSQREAVLQEMGVDPNAVTIVEVTNAEEHRYLAISCRRAPSGGAPSRRPRLPWNSRVRE